MIAVVEREHSVTEKPRRSWFGFRFTLRTLLLLTALAAVLLSLEAWRTRDQRELAARLEEFGAHYEREPRQWVPEFARQLLDQEHTGPVVSFELEVMQVPTLRDVFVVRLAEPAEIEELLGMPAMVHVRSIQLSGTAVTDDVLDELAALENLVALSFSETAVTANAVKKWKTLRPTCTVTYAEWKNGSRAVEYQHREVLNYTDRLDLFPRAQRGEQEAITDLLQIAGRTEGHRPRVIMNFLWQMDGEVSLPPFTEALRTGGPGIRQAVAELLGHLDAVDLLTELLSDPDAGVRVEAVCSLSRVDGQAARLPLVRAAENSEPEVRIVALRELPKTLGQEGLPQYLAALRDPHPDVRWQAIYAIEQTSDERAAEALIELLSDASSVNRCAAARVLGKFDKPEAIPALRLAAKEDDDPDVRSAAEAALASVQD